eukprot:UN05124
MMFYRNACCASSYARYTDYLIFPFIKCGSKHI